MILIYDLIESAKQSPLTSKHAAGIIRGRNIIFISSNYYSNLGCNGAFSHHAEEKQRLFQNTLFEIRTILEKYGV